MSNNHNEEGSLTNKNNNVEDRQYEDADDHALVDESNLSPTF